MLAKSFEHATITGREIQDGKTYAFITMACDRCQGRGIYAVGVHNGQLVPASPDGGTCYKCLGTGKVYDRVRDYTPAEWDSQLKAQAKIQARRDKKASKREEERVAINKEYAHSNMLRAGFNDYGIGYVISGNTYSIKDALHEAGGKFTYALGWILPQEPSQDLIGNRVCLEVTADRLMPERPDGTREFATDAKEYIASLLPAKLSSYYGNVGDKICLRLALVRSTCYSGAYGLSYFHNFVDTEEHEFVWSTATELEGEFFVISGTIKEHREYNGVKQTYITRCKVQEGK